MSNSYPVTYNTNTIRPHIWREKPGSFRLSNNEIHIWYASLELEPGVIKQFRTILSHKEKQRAINIKRAINSDYYIAAHGILRVILAQYLDVLPGTIQFGYNQRGKPQLKGEQGKTLTFNISHSNQLVLYAITETQEIGIDIEHIDKSINPQRLAKRYFSPKESSTLQQLPKEEQFLAFFTGWTRKEAYLKALGIGLTYPTSEFSVSLNMQSVVHSLNPVQNGKAPETWTLKSFHPNTDSIGTVAIKGSKWKLTYFDYHKTLNLCKDII